VATHPMTKAYQAWVQALEEMRAALTANPLVADPFMASAQVFEDIGRVIFGGHAEPKQRKRERAQAKKTSAKKKAPARKR